MSADIEVRAGDNICDFCSDAKPERVYKSPDFTMDESHPEIGVPGMRSKGAWIACLACAALIDKEDWDGLVLRAVSRLGPKYDGMMPRRILADTVRRSHTLFREHCYKRKT
jgi:hypothetical protein